MCESDNSSILLNGDISQSRMKYCYVNWKIKAFLSILTRKYDVCCSPEFYFSGGRWHITWNLNELNDGRLDEYVTLSLRRFLPFISFNNALVVFGVKDKDENLYKSCVITKRFDDGDFYCCESFKLVTIRDLYGDRIIDSEGTITFFVLISTTNECTRNADSQTSTYESFTDSTNLSQDFKKLFLSERNSDVMLKVVDKEFCAHSQILAARSSVFAPMFTHDMKEKTSGIVVVPDCHPEAFKQLLMFMYCGQVDKISTDIALHLYCAAEKYDVKDLKIQCSDFMKKDMSVDTFCDVISLAIKYSDMELIDYAKEFFVQNIENIIVTGKWLSFARKYLVHAHQFILKAVMHFRRK